MRQSLESLFRTTTVRLAVRQAAVVGVGVVALLAYVYISTVGQFLRDADAAAASEYQSLERAYAEGGVSRLRQEVIERSARQEDMLYVLIDASGQTLYQDLSPIPSLPGGQPVPIASGFTRIAPDGAETQVRARGQMGRLLGGPVLLVVRDLGDAAAISTRITSALITVAVLGAVFAIISGLLASRQAAQRAEALSHTAREVMEGDLTRRAPRGAGNDEFDALAQDINAMLDQLERLVHTTRTAGDSIAHDLRSPLTRLKQRLEAAQRSPPNSEGEREALKKAIEEADKLLETFASVLRVSRVESVANWRFEVVDISAIVRELVEFYEPAAEEAGVSFKVFATDGLSLKGEGQLITQALSNLIENALKYTPAGGRVEIRAEQRADGRIELAVIDDGPGVPHADRQRVTERFVRLEASRTTPGTGLGLALVSAVARLHRGVLFLGDGLGGAADRPGLRAALVLPAAA
ncbi:MAG: ATP-binding protein [Hyphomonadaceae bacterium]